MKPDHSGTDNLSAVSGVVYGTRIQGLLPAVFQAHLRTPVCDTVGAEWPLTVSYRSAGALPQVEEFSVMTDDNRRTTGRFSLFREPGGFGLKIRGPDSGLFRIGPSRIEIEWLARESDPAHFFYSCALPLWLECKGVPVLHASAVLFDGRAVGFVGRSGTGKSTLCNALLHLGCKFIADDGLALREDAQGKWGCLDSPPVLRLWSSASEQQADIPVKRPPNVRYPLEKRPVFLGEKYVNCDKAPELTAVYVLERGPDTTTKATIAPCKPNEALMRLFEFSLASAPAAALGLTPARLGRLSRAAQKTRVAYLNYPSGVDHGRRIKEMILADLERRD